jgi:hypothetical protein
MDGITSAVDLAERVAQIASGLNIQTVLIGAYALAAHHYVRATADIDLASDVKLDDLRRLEQALREAGLHTELRQPDEEDPLGGVIEIWERVDETGDPVDAVEVVNFYNPYRPRRTPAMQAIRNGIPIAEKPALRYPRLDDLIALKLDTGSRRDEDDVIDVLVANPDANLDEIRATCKAYGLDRIDALIAAAQETRAKGR